jgi:crotonobetainyl-CoA:carnitine CoA-transferase CaiB-like acyl-CoA transferase
MVQFVMCEHMQGATFDPPTSAPGYARTLSRSRRPYATQDGFLAVLPYNDGQWRRFFEAVGKGHIFKEDPRFADIAARTTNIDALYDMIADELKARPTAEWLKILQDADIACMVPHTLETLLEDPHLQDRGFFQFREHPSEGRIRTMREPSTWSETPPPSDRFAPRLGQHTGEVLAEAGYGQAQIDDMIGKRIAFPERRG